MHQQTGNLFLSTAPRLLPTFAFTVVGPSPVRGSWRPWRRTLVELWDPVTRTAGRAETTARDTLVSGGRRWSRVAKQ